MEGFGLPNLEAMQCGCPVATTNRSSMPEIGGDAAIYFNPENDSEIADAITRLSGDPALRERLSADGRRRAAQFSWDRTAERTVAVYEELLA
jgi:glycosyltransferase involved in cell wall biosynthesis